MGWPKPGILPPRPRMSAAIAVTTASRVLAGRDALRRRDQNVAAELRRAEDHRAAAEDAGGERALERLRVGVVGHARGDRGRRQPVLGDGDEEQVEEEALLVARLFAGHQEEEELGEGLPPHQVAR